MSEADATQGADNTEVDTDGADNAGDTNGSSVPSTLAALTQPPTTPAAKMIPQAKVNKIAAKAREEGFNAALRELMSRYEVDSEDDLSVLVSEGRKVRPAPKDKVVADLEAKLAEQARKVVELEDNNRRAAIERVALPHLMDAHKPLAALTIIQEELGFRLKVKADGSVGVFEAPFDDDDELDISVATALKNGKAKLRWLFKSTVEAPVVAARAVKTKSEAEAEQRAEEDLGANPRHRYQEIMALAKQAAMKSVPR